MTLQQSTSAKIENLAKEIIEGPRDDKSTAHYGYMVIVTSSYNPDDDRGLSDGLLLKGSTARLYQESLDLLGQDNAVEHLTSANLRDALTSFAVRLESDKETLRGRGARRARIAEFIAEIAKPLSTYEIAFTVDGVAFGDEDILKIGDVEFRTFTSEMAEEWDLESFPSRLPIPDAEVIGLTVGILKVQAGTLEKALERGEEALDQALQILRTSIGFYRPSQIYDFQLHQRRGDLRVIRQLDPETKLWRGWKGRRGPLETQLTGDLLDSTRSFTAQLSPLFDDSIPRKLRDAVLRSLEWVGTSVTREIYDHKVVDLCTALEAVLSGRDDRRKGEAVALRVMLLSMALGKGFRFPGDLYRLYVLRSNVVHGSDLGECGQSDYYSLKAIAEETILNIMELHEREGPFRRPYDLFTFLEKPDRIKSAVSWLDHYLDNNTREIAKYARGLLEASADKCTEIVKDKCATTPSD